MSFEAPYDSFRNSFTYRLRRFLSFLLIGFSPLLPDYQHLASSNENALQVKTYTALGDSFAAGLRAIPGGHLPWCDDPNSKKDNCTSGACLKNLGSYCYQMSTSDQFNIGKFNFLACAGSNTISCKDDQVNGPDFGTPDIVSVHVGGNNNDSFGPVMVNCVYKRGWGCDEALKKAESTIANIGIHYDDLFAAIRAKPQLDRDQSRHVFAMSYPTFYNVTEIGSCQSWQINYPSAGKDGLRQKLNNMVDGINEQLRNATVRAGPNFHFVDTEPYFAGHRLCDRTGDVWFQYLLEWAAANPADAETDYRRVIETTDLFQQGPFHPNLSGHKALLRALADAVRDVLQRDDGR